MTKERRLHFTAFMTRRGIVILGCIGAALLVASCATTPKPVPATAPSQPKPAPAVESAPAPQPAPEAKVPAPNSELAKAKSMKQEIDRYQLGKLVAEAYRKGSSELTAGEQAVGSDNAAAKSKLEAAISDFQKVLETGFPLALKQETQRVAQAKAAADEAKADKAAPDLYKQAASLQAQAAAKEQAGSPAEALDLLKQATVAYGKAETVAKQKRAEAEAALKKADEQIGQAKSQVEQIQKGLESSSTQGGTTGTGQPAGGGQ